MPTRDVFKARRWRFRLCGAHDAVPGQYKAPYPITEAELRARLRAVFQVSRLPDLECWPEGDVKCVNAD